MRAVCTYTEGNDFDPKVGEIVDLEDPYITSLYRNGSEIDLEDPERPGYFKPEAYIHSLLKEGDEIEENYGCMYRVV